MKHTLLLLVLVFNAPMALAEDDAPSVPVDAAHAQALQTLVLDTVPAGSPLRADDTFARNARSLEMMAEYLAVAEPLDCFAPLQLVHVIYMAAGAGPPGQVLEDVRVLYDPRSDRFFLPTPEALSALRDVSPLDVTTLTEAQLRRLITEHVSLSTAFRLHTFTLDTLTPEGDRTWRITYTWPDHLGMGSFGDASEQVVFQPNGAIQHFPLIGIK